eukprot:TRINITY_DN17425_c0_g1_i1.p1 TRINITY_DN17425_c0_g1~~TRINITY_DN17425_c0_g1_i1.p1  ORF type:complete len:721 (-),score=125.57 TRINITY_DN17425_c0_g1_i1:148-2310(-)
MAAQAVFSSSISDPSTSFAATCFHASRACVNRGMPTSIPMPTTFYGKKLGLGKETRTTKSGSPSARVCKQKWRRGSVQMSATIDKAVEESIVVEEIDLAPLSLDGPLREALSDLGVKRLTTIPGILKSKRPAKAIVLYPRRFANAKNLPGAGVPAVVFGHGFSQGPKNYMSTLKRFAEAGFVVISPTTFLGVTDMLFSKIDGSGFLAKAPTKLQTALCTDLLRSVQHLFSDGHSLPKIGKVFLSGHSMGGGCSLIVASYLKESLVGSVGVMAPAVKGLMKSPVNPDLHMDGSRGDYLAASKFFADKFPTSPLFILAGNDDRVVKPTESGSLFLAAFSAKEDNKLEDVTLFSMEGCHIGFEDALNADLTAKSNLIDKVIFPIINFLVYDTEVLRGITKDTEAQKRVAQELLVGSFLEVLGEGPKVSMETTAKDVAGEVGLGRDFQIGQIKKSGEVDKVGAAVLATSQALSDADLKDQKDVNPIPATLAVSSYAVAHALTLLISLQLYSEHPSIGLAGLTALASGLVYDNTTLAIGRLFGYLDDGEFIPEDKGRFLAVQSLPRFFFHSLVPLLVFTGLGLASRAGVPWAGSLPIQGAAGLGVAAVCLVSLIRNTLLLELRPRYTSGILHYTYDDPNIDFTRIIPSIMSCVILTALGYSTYQENPSLLPFFAGPLLAIILNAIPSEKNNPGSLRSPIIFGNLGEVILLASLACSEALLQGQGL